MKYFDLFCCLMVSAFLTIGCTSPDAKSNNVNNNPNNVNNTNNGNNSNNSNNANNINDPTFFECTFNDECIVRARECCDVCSEQNPVNSVAINASQAQAYAMAACGERGLECPACETPATPTIIPTCNAGTCEIVDIQAEPTTECSEPEDCILRTNTCCECTDVSIESVVAVNVNSAQDIPGWRCGDQVACDDCVPTYEGWVADCSPDGRCVASQGANL